MIGRVIINIAMAAALVIASTSVGVAQGNWAGVWMSGDMRTLIAQDGQRVYGAFERIGEFDGRVSTDGNTVRAVVTIAPSGTRGFVELRKTSPDLVLGVVSERRFPSLDGPVFQGRLHLSERTGTDPGSMSFYDGNNRSYSVPVRYANAPDPAIDAWLAFDTLALPDLRPANDPSTWTPERMTPDIEPFVSDQTQSPPSGQGGGRPLLFSGLGDRQLPEMEMPDGQSDVPQIENASGPCDLWEGYWGEGERTWALVQTDGRVVGTLSNDGILTYLEGRISPSGRILRLVLNRPDGSIGYFEAMMNGDNASFSGGVSASPGGAGGMIDANRAESFRPDIPLDFEYFPGVWNGRPPAHVAAWLDGGDDFSGSVAGTESLAGRWSAIFDGTRFGPFASDARILLTQPAADGVAVGEIMATGGGSALLYGNMLSTNEFRGVFIIMDGQGRNPTGQWGTIRLLGNAGSGQMEGQWAYSYRMPTMSRREGIPGGTVVAQLAREADPTVVSRDRLGVERALVALETFAGPMPIFNPELPRGEVLFALQRWWRGEGELCAAGCASAQPTRLAVDALRIVPQPPHALIPRTPIYSTLYRVRLSADARFRDESGRVTRSPDTGGGAYLVDPRFLFNQQVRVQNYAISGRPQPRTDEPVGYCDTLETTTQLGENRRTAIIALPETLLMSPEGEVTLAVTAEVELAGELLSPALGPTTVQFNVLEHAAKVAAYRAANGQAPRTVSELGCDRGHVWLAHRGSDEAFELSVKWEFLP